MIVIAGRVVVDPDNNDAAIPVAQENDARDSQRVRLRRI